MTIGTASESGVPPGRILRTRTLLPRRPDQGGPIDRGYSIQRAGRESDVEGGKGIIFEHTGA